MTHSLVKNSVAFIRNACSKTVGHLVQRRSSFAKNVAILGPVGASRRCRRFCSAKAEKGVVALLNRDNWIMLQQLPLLHKLGIWSMAGGTVLLMSPAWGAMIYGLLAMPAVLLHYDTLRGCTSKLQRDIRFARGSLRASFLHMLLTNKNMRVTDCFYELAKSYPYETMMYYENTKWTYKQAEMLVNKVTNFFMRQNYERGDVVAMYVTNRPEYITLILGLSNIGVVPALINTQYKNDTLLHAIRSSQCKGVIVSEDLLKDFEQIKDNLKGGAQIFTLDGKGAEKYVNLSNSLIGASSCMPDIIQQFHRNDALAYLYVNDRSDSKPRAVVLTHKMFLLKSVLTSCLLEMQALKDVVYNPLPFYLANGLILGASPAIVSAVPVVISRKFSPQSFWTDCVYYKCTIANALGEYCNGLLTKLKGSPEEKHCLKKVIADGLHQQAWVNFANRYKVPVVELCQCSRAASFIAASKPSDVRAVPAFIPQFLQAVSIREIQPYTLPTRASKPIPVSINPRKTRLIAQPQESFSPAEALERSRKIFINAYQFQNPGLLREEEKAEPKRKAKHLFFPSTVPESYSWRGSTVTPAQIESVMANLTGHSQCAAYGVQIPGVYEKAGMITMTDPRNSLNLDQLMKEVKKHLPEFALPVFVRVTNDKNAYFNKQELASQGFDPAQIKDKLYYMNKNGAYRPLTVEVYKNILRKNILL